MIPRVPFALFVLVTLQACGTYQYVPSEYPVVVKDDAIPAFDIAGDVSIANAQDRTAPVIISSYGGTELQTDYRSVTGHMVEAARRELARRGRRSAGGPSKSIALKVTYIRSKYTMLMWLNELSFQATLGDGKEVNKTITTTHGGGPQPGVTGCIGFGIIALFKDSAVQAYLADRKPAAAARAAPVEVRAPRARPHARGPGDLALALRAPAAGPTR